MRTILVELVNQKAIQLLQDMEDLSLIRIIGNNVEDDESSYGKSRINPSSMRGNISSDTAEKILDYIKRSKNEWE